MEELDKRAPFIAAGGRIPPEFRSIKTPCYILDENALRKNAKLLGKVNYYDYIKAALNEIEGVDGIFASSDLIAAQVIQVCNEIKIRIPEDIKLVGFDDVDISQLTTPRITTVHQPIKEMARLSIELINAKYNNIEVNEKTILSIKLIIRESTVNK